MISKKNNTKVNGKRFYILYDNMKGERHGYGVYDYASGARYSG